MKSELILILLALLTRKPSSPVPSGLGSTKSSSKGTNSPVPSSETISIHDLKGSISLGLSTVTSSAGSTLIDPCNVSITIDDKSHHITDFDINNNIIKTLKRVNDTHKINLSLIPEKGKKKSNVRNISSGKSIKEDTNATSLSQALRYTANITPLSSIIKSRNKVTIHKIGQVSGQPLGNGHARVLVEVSLNPNCSFLLLDTLVLVSLQAFPNLKVPQSQTSKSSAKTPSKTPTSSKSKQSYSKQPEASSRVKVRPHGVYNELTQVVMWQCGTLKAKDPPTQLHVIVDLGPGSENSSDPSTYSVPVIVKGKFQDAPLTSTLVVIDDEHEYLDVNIKYTNKVEYRFL